MVSRWPSGMTTKTKQIDHDSAIEKLQKGTTGSDRSDDPSLVSEH